MVEPVEAKVIAITGASSGFGALMARALARRGHTVYAGLRDAHGRNAQATSEFRAFAAESGVALRAVELDVTRQDTIDAAIDAILERSGRLDVVVHNAGHMVVGPAEAFLPEQLLDLYDTNVVGTQRLNRTALPHLRAQRSGLVVWIGSSSTRGGTPPYLAPYFAAKAAMDALAVSYAAELLRFGIDTTIVVPGAFTSGTNHFAHAGLPEDAERAEHYAELYGETMQGVFKRLEALIPPEADAVDVAQAVVSIVDTPRGSRPFRVHVDPSRDGSEVVSAVADRIRVEFFRRIGLDDLLTATSSL